MFNTVSRPSSATGPNANRAERWGLRAFAAVCLLLVTALAWGQSAPQNHRGWWFMALQHGTQPDFIFQTKDSTAGHKVLAVYDNTGTEVWSMSREGVGASGGGAVRATADFTANSSSTGTTLTNVTGMSLNLVSGQKYLVEAALFTTSTTNGGLKLAFGGTATATAIITQTSFYTTTTLNTSTQQTSLGALAGATVATDRAQVWAYISCNAGGTLTLQAAQNASHADTTTVKTGSWMTARIVN